MTCAAETVFYYVAGDNLPALVVQYLDSEGAAIDISGYTIDLHIGYVSPVTVNANIYDPTNGYFKFEYSDTDLVEGKWRVEIQITNLASQKLTIQDIMFDIKGEIA